MRRLMLLLSVSFLFGCAHGVISSEDQTREYAATTVSLSDFSMKIMSYYQSENRPVPGDFDANRFFALLERIYPHQSRVSSVKDNYSVSARALDGGYSVMLCDQKTGRKIMEDLSCHLDRVEVRSWENNVNAPCAFETQWAQYCR